ncbi:GGDEF domain-containing protein [Rhizobium sp. 18065]|uniref:GGDEF domain-containing protein n=1 Tax=Rhizobium sp. 18065 TaxID=2681411 RepID=UPI00135788C8|nr:GGDEF domain-containing protein [Rhizobium sp. 18065]
MELTLHLPTILVVHGMAMLIATLLCIAIWIRERPNNVLAMLMIAGTVTCVSMALHGSRTMLPLPLASGVGLALAVIGAGFFWQAVVAFEGKPLSMTKATMGGVIWLCCWLVPPFVESTAIRTLVLALLLCSYCLLSSREIWLGRVVEPLLSRPLAAAANALRGLVWLASIPLSLLVSPPYGANGSNASWFSLLAVANTMLIVLSLIAMLMLAKERDERLYRLASERDPLTNLANRRTFVMTAQSILASEKGRATLLLLDIDHFKRINDTHGHAAGDRVLIAFSRAIDKRMPKGWIFARIGGEEFACLLPNASGAHGLAIAENLRMVIETMHLDADRLVPVTVSIGVATASDASVLLDTLLAEADAALYQAKAKGRNCVCLHDTMAMLDVANAQLETVKSTMGRTPLARIRHRN